MIYIWVYIKQKVPSIASFGFGFGALDVFVFLVFGLSGKCFVINGILS